MLRKLTSDVCEKTGIEGKASISRELKAAEAEFDNTRQLFDETRAYFDKRSDGWNKFTKLHDGLTEWIHDTESQVKDFTLRPTLEEKLADIDSLKVNN